MYVCVCYSAHTDAQIVLHDFAWDLFQIEEMCVGVGGGAYQEPSIPRLTLTLEVGI